MASAAEPIIDLSWAVLEQLATDLKSRRPRIRKQAESERSTPEVALYLEIVGLPAEQILPPSSQMAPLHASLSS